MSRPKVRAWKTGVCKECQRPIAVGDTLKLFEGVWIHTECAPKPPQKPVDSPWLAPPNPWRDPRLAEILGYEIAEDAS